MTQASKRERNIHRTYTLAYCSLAAALGSALMFTGGLIPVMTYCAPLVVGVLLIPVQREFGRRWAWAVWAVTAALALMITPDKEAGLFYLFLGYYPILKAGFDRLRPAPLRWLAKLLFFAAALALMVALIFFVFDLKVLAEELRDFGLVAGILFYAGLAAVMLVYDVALRNLARLYERRLRPKLKHWR